MALSEPDMVVLLGAISAVLLALALGAGIVAALKISEVAGLHNRLLSLGYPVNGDDTAAANAPALALPLPAQAPQKVPQKAPETVHETIQVSSPPPSPAMPATPVITRSEKSPPSDAAHAALERAEPLIRTGQRYVALSADATYTLGVITDVLEWLNRHPDDADQVRRLSQAALTASRHLTRQVRSLSAENDA